MGCINTHMPYTYLIGWSHLDRWYYGVRYTSGCTPGEFWVKYFTSSEVVKRMRVEHGDPDVIEIRREFASAVSARHWEERVLRRVKAVRSPRWLNLQNSGKEFNSTGEATRAKISAANKGRVNPPASAETRAKIAAWQRNKVVSEATKEKLRQANLGKTILDHVRAMISAKTSGINNPNYGGRHQTEEVRERMRGPRADSSRMGRWERTPEFRAAKSAAQKEASHFVTANPMSSAEMRAKVAASKIGKRAHFNEDQPGARKMFVLGSAPPGWHLPGIG